MAKKNFFLKYVNIRYIRAYIFHAMSGVGFLKQNLNLHSNYKWIDDLTHLKLANYEEVFATNLSPEEKDFFKLPEEIIYNKKIYFIQNAHFNGYTGTTISSCGNVVSNYYLEDTKVNKNQIFPKVLKNTSGDDNSFYVNCLGYRRGHKQIYHFYQDIISLIALIFLNIKDLQNLGQEQKIDNITFLVRKDLNGIQKLFYENLPKQIGNFKVVIKILNQNDKLFCKNILHPFITSNFYRNYIDQQTIDFANNVMQEAISMVQSSHENIFISRADAKIRRLKNEGEVIKALQNYHKVVASKLSPLQQIATFKNAKSIVAIHGAGLTNLIYASGSSSVTEIFPSNYNDAAYVLMSKMKGLNYKFILGSKGDMWQNFSVDESQVKA